MPKFVGSALTIPAASTTVHAVQKGYVDSADAALSARVASLEAGANTGGKTLSVRSASAAIIAAAGDFILADASSGAFTVILPTAPTTNTSVAVKKVDTSLNLVTVVGPTGPPAVTIDGDSSCTLTQAQSGAIFVYDGANWRVEATVIFDPGAKNFTYRGAWDSTVTYGVNDVVFYNRNAYVAIVASTSSAPIVDASNSVWGLLALHGYDVVAAGVTATSGTTPAVTITGTPGNPVFNFTLPKGDPGATGAGFTYQGTWNSGTTYFVRDVVALNGSTYVATSGSVGQDPSTTSGSWALWAAKGGGATSGYKHVQSTAGAVWIITHNLGFDPGGLKVITSDGDTIDDAVTQYVDPGVTLRLSFDLSIAGTAYLS